MNATDFLQSKNIDLAPIYVLHKEEDFLKRRVIDKLLLAIFGTGDRSGLSTYSPDQIAIQDLLQELETIPFLGDYRVVIIDQADSFISSNRESLEKYFQFPSDCSILILDCKTWASGTKLAKLLPEEQTILCTVPPPNILPKWLAQWCKAHYQKILPMPACELLIEMIGTHLGILDQELKKLSDAIGERTSIEVADVQQLVNRTMEGDVFLILNHICDNRAAEGFAILERLLAKGTDPIGIAAPFSYQLRKLAQTARFYQQSKNLELAMDEANVPSYFAIRDNMKKQLKHLGRDRLEKIYDWLMELDLGLKGHNPLAPRLQIERFLARLT